MITQNIRRGFTPFAGPVHWLKGQETLGCARATLTTGSLTTGCVAIAVNSLARCSMTIFSKRPAPYLLEISPSPTHETLRDGFAMEIATATFAAAGRVG
jgi:hypothetical protein